MPFHLCSSLFALRDLTPFALTSPSFFPPGRESLPYEGGLTSVPGLRVGHDTLDGTGSTVVLCEPGATAGVDVRGSAPGTRETDLLNPVNTIHQVHAILLAGGSAFGLQAAAGVIRFLEERGIGYPTRFARVPIVPAAILYDLGIGDPGIRPDAESGYRACQYASSGPVAEGNVGAGTGATVGKALGPERGMKAGIGSCSRQVGPLIVAALAAVNATGDIVDPRSARIVAGARSTDGKGLADAMREMLRGGSSTDPFAIEATTLVVVATNGRFSKAQTTKIAQMSHDGLARSINPVHTPYDGDTVFALSTGEVEGQDPGLAGAIAAEVTARAVVRAALQAKGIPGFPSARDLLP